MEKYKMIKTKKKYREQVIMYSTMFSLILSFVLFFPYISNNSYARVTGPCSDCHTMHNSQGGMQVEGFMAFEDDGTANRTLLATTCIGCHTGTNDGNNATPYVMGTSQPVFGKDGNTLAGGNFWWVAQGDDEKGHNVAGITGADTLDKAPGLTKNESCAVCHFSLADPIFIEYGISGCIGCHLAPKHHADDTRQKINSANKLVDSAEQGWYRFLSGHRDGDGMGVKGIENERWNYGATKTSHNEYLGNVVQGGGDGFDELGYTTTAFCTGCHGLFHTDQRDGDEKDTNPWIRHPSDCVIPETGEYANAFDGEYDPYVPVARTSLTGVANNNIVTPGSDMVMCLSCHVAHGSPYPDMLRWDYDDMIAGGGDTGGCFKCHTEKN